VEVKVQVQVQVVVVVVMVKQLEVQKVERLLVVENAIPKIQIQIKY